MQADEMISAVRESTGLESQARAEQALRATLTVLGQRVAGEASDLAAQLPGGLAEAVPTSDEAERFGLEDFYARVAELEGAEVDERAARRHSRAVTALLREVYPDAYGHLLAQLPDDWSDLAHTDGVTH